MSDPQLGFQGYSGRLGQWSFSKRNGRMVVSQVRASGPRTATPGQEEVKRTFRAASAYARDVRDDPALRAPYEPLATVRKTSAYQAAMADYLRPPWVEAIDLDGFKGLTGDPIRIRAFDDVEVMSVLVELRAADNTVLEQGAATKNGDKWVYAATAAHPKGTPVTITATAVDRPGNKGSKMVTWS